MTQLACNWAKTLLLIPVLLVSGCAGRTLMSTPSVYERGDVPLFIGLSPTLQGNQLDVLYVTDRLPDLDISGDLIGYGNQRSTSAALGSAVVEVDSRDDRSMSSSRPRINIVAVDEIVRFPETPYLYRAGERGRIEIDPEIIADLRRTHEQAREEIVRRLALTPRKEVYVDVHGVANDFDDAIFGLASFWHFLGREGVPVAYSWPAGSKGILFYGVDRESGEFTVVHLKEFLRLLVEIAEVERIHISAHSRGTDVVLTALRELIIETRAKGLDPREHLRIENLILVAADMDLGVAVQRIGGDAIGPAFGRITIYINVEDQALAAAKRLLKSSQRLGSVDMAELGNRHRELLRRAENVDVVVYEGTGGGFFRHGYYTDPAVSSDIVVLLRYGWKPGEEERRGLERLDDNTWRIDAG